MVCMDTTVLNQTHTYKSFSNSTNLSILGKYTVLHLINRDNCWLKVKTDVAYDFYFITKLAVHIEFQITLKRTQMWYQLIGIYNQEKIQERIWIPLRSKCEDIVNWKQIADFVWYHICKKKGTSNGNCKICLPSNFNGLWAPRPHVSLAVENKEVCKIAMVRKLFTPILNTDPRNVAAVSVIVILSWSPSVWGAWMLLHRASCTFCEPSRGWMCQIMHGHMVSEEAVMAIAQVVEEEER